MAPAPADPGAGAVAEAGRLPLLQLPRGADQRSGPRALPQPCRDPLAPLAAAAQPEGQDHLAADQEAGGGLAPETTDPSSLAGEAVRRQTPEVGAVCGNAARTVLCGGRSAMSVPTAITYLYEKEFLS